MTLLLLLGGATNDAPTTATAITTTLAVAGNPLKVQKRPLMATAARPLKIKKVS